MTYDLILKNVAKHINLEEEERDYFTSLLTLKKVCKKDLILYEGQTCKKINFVHSGALRAYYMDKEGREATIMFAMTDWWVTDMYCFLNNKPALMHIKAISDSCIFELSKDHLEALYVKVPKFERFFRILMQNAYTREQLRVIENLSFSAEQRYESFLKKYPQIAQAVTQKQIASYLGITPEFLSALRNRRRKR